MKNRTPEATDPRDPPHDPTTELRGAYGAAMVEGRGDEAERIALGALAAGRSVASLYEEVMAPAMAQVGELWAAGEMTIADEHLASALNLKVMASVYTASLPSRPRRSAGRVLLAGVEGDRHGVGLRMAGDVIDLAGFELIYLGEDVPTDKLLRTLTAVEPDVLAVGIPTPSAAAAAVPILAAVRRSHPQVPLVIGGQGVLDESMPRGVQHGATLSDLAEQVARAVPGGRRSEASWPVAAELLVRRPVTRTDASPEDRLLDIAADSAEVTRAGARVAEAYRRLAHEDPLTGVANRRAFEERIAHTIEAGGPATIVLVDLDGFKLVNDRHGHLAGDKVLTAVARLLESVAGPDGFVARLGGDEFALLLGTASVQVAKAQGARFLEALRSDPVAGEVTATCGISLLGDDRRQALIAADVALYRGKASGGDTVEFD